MSSTSVYDVLVIGGGPSGLSAALTLARALHSVVVFDSGIYRNERAPFMHTMPTWDHRSPAEYRAAARQELLTRYNTVSFQDAKVSNITKNEAGVFEASTGSTELWRSKVIILATGCRDLYPDLDGYNECWVKGIFHCLFCHGYEDRSVQSAGVLAIGDLAAGGPALHIARQAQALVGQVTVYTNGSRELAQTIQTNIPAHHKSNITTDARRIIRLVKEPEGSRVTLHFEDQSEPSNEGFLAHKPKITLNGPFASQLGLELTLEGDIKTMVPGGQTSVGGVFAIGDCGTKLKTIANAVATGSNAAAFASAHVQAMVPVR